MCIACVCRDECCAGASTLAVECAVWMMGSRAPWRAVPPLVLNVVHWLACLLLPLAATAGFGVRARTTVPRAGALRVGAPFPPAVLCSPPCPSHRVPESEFWGMWACWRHHQSAAQAALACQARRPACRVFVRRVVESVVSLHPVKSEHVLSCAGVCWCQGVSCAELPWPTAQQFKRHDAAASHWTAASDVITTNIHHTARCAGDCGCCAGAARWPPGTVVPPCTCGGGLRCDRLTQGRAPCSASTLTRPRTHDQGSHVLQ